MNSDKEWLIELVERLSAVLAHIDQLEAEKLELEHQNTLFKKQNRELYEYRNQVASEKTSLWESISEFARKADYYKNLSSQYHRQRDKALEDIVELRNEIANLKPISPEEKE